MRPKTEYRKGATPMSVANNIDSDNSSDTVKSRFDDFKSIHTVLMLEGESTGEILKDETKAGRDRGWSEKKQLAQQVGAVYTRLADRNVSKEKFYRRRAENLCSCGNSLVFKECPEGHEKYLYGAFFCKVRLCPLCTWRRALKHGHQAKRILHELVQEKPNQRFIMLTLTVKNCKAKDLKKVIGELLKAWDKMSRRKFFKNAVSGWFRALEVTFSLARGDFHPHLHIIIAVTPSYFKKNYVKHSQWVDEWQSALKVDYSPVVYVKVAGEDKEGKRIGQKQSEILTPVERAKMVAEGCKYTTKATDILIGSEATQEFVLKYLDDALARRKLVAYGGELMDIFKRLKYEEVDETTDLINVDEDEQTKRCNCKTCGSEFINKLYEWCNESKQYLAKEVTVSDFHID